MSDILLLKLSRDNIEHEIVLNFQEQEIHIDKSQIGTNEEECFKHNVLAVARKYKFIKKLVVDLANHGFFLVEHDSKQGISIFRKLDDYEKFLSAFNNPEIKLWNNTYYTLEKPLVSDEKTSYRMLVIFSSIADFPLNASIFRRSFFKNWGKVQNFIPKNTYVLRIADIGGVLGSFYLNSNFDHFFEDKIQSLIKKISEDLSINKNDIVLFGTSKGATGALYHGILGKYSTVAVDPIVSDEYYINEMNDLHFVEGAFPVSKEDKFNTIIDKNENLKNINIITSKNSQQFVFIDSLFCNRSDINYFVFTNPYIKTHPDVGPNTLVFSTTLINSIFYNMYNPCSMYVNY